VQFQPPIADRKVKIPASFHMTTAKARWHQVWPARVQSGGLCVLLRHGCQSELFKYAATACLDSRCCNRYRQTGYRVSPYNQGSPSNPKGLWTKWRERTFIRLDSKTLTKWQLGFSAKWQAES